MVFYSQLVLVLLALSLSSVNALDVYYVDAEAPKPLVPFAPKTYPKALQGMIWMDQSGFISNSQVPASEAAPDAGLTFGDPANKLDTENNEIFVDTTGPAWQWINIEKGYKEFHTIKTKIIHGDPAYRFAFNEDYTFAQIYLAYWGYELPKHGLSFTMTLLTPPEGKCPPKANASKDEFTQCATWKRQSVGDIFFPLGDYYVFQVMDADGKPVQPYFDKFIEYIKSKSTKKSCEKAADYGIVEESHMAAMSCEEADIFVGTKGRKASRWPAAVWYLVTITLALMGLAIFVGLAMLAWRKMKPKCKGTSARNNPGNSEDQSLRRSLLA